MPMWPRWAIRLHPHQCGLTSPCLPWSLLVVHSALSLDSKRSTTRLSLELSLECAARTSDLRMFCSTSLATSLALTSRIAWFRNSIEILGETGAWRRVQIILPPSLSLFTKARFKMWATSISSFKLMARPDRQWTLRWWYSMYQPWLQTFHASKSCVKVIWSLPERRKELEKLKLEIVWSVLSETVATVMILSGTS